MVLSFTETLVSNQLQFQYNKYNPALGNIAVGSITKGGYTTPVVYSIDASVVLGKNTAMQVLTNPDSFASFQSFCSSIVPNVIYLVGYVLDNFKIQSFISRFDAGSSTFVNYLSPNTDDFYSDVIRNYQQSSSEAFFVTKMTFFSPSSISVLRVEFQSGAFSFGTPLTSSLTEANLYKFAYSHIDKVYVVSGTDFSDSLTVGTVFKLNFDTNLLEVKLTFSDFILRDIITNKSYNFYVCGSCQSGQVSSRIWEIDSLLKSIIETYALDTPSQFLGLRDVKTFPTAEIYICGASGTLPKVGQIWYLNTAVSSTPQLLLTNPSEDSIFYTVASDGKDGLIATGCTGITQTPGFIYSTAVPCLLPGTLITLGNLEKVPIETITVGAYVMGCLSKTPKKVLGVSCENVGISQLQPTNKVFKIPKSSIGVECPANDLYISGHHRVFVSMDNNRVTAIPAYRLSVSEKVSYEMVEYWHLEVEDDDGFFANGLGVESFVQNNV